MALVADYVYLTHVFFLQVVQKAAARGVGTVALPPAQPSRSCSPPKRSVREPYICFEPGKRRDYENVDMLC